MLLLVVVVDVTHCRARLDGAGTCLNHVHNDGVMTVGPCWRPTLNAPSFRIDVDEFTVVCREEFTH